MSDLEISKCMGQIMNATTQQDLDKIMKDYHEDIWKEAKHLISVAMFL